MRDQINIHITFGFKYNSKISTQLYNRLVEYFIPYLRYCLTHNQVTTVENVQIHMERNHEN